MATLSDPRQIRLSAATNRRIRKVSKKSGLTETDTARLAIDAGLPIIEALPELIERAALEKVAKAKATSCPTPFSP